MLKHESQTEPLQGRDYERGAMAQRYLFCRRVRMYGGAGRDSDDMRRLITDPASEASCVISIRWSKTGKRRTSCS